MEKINIKGLTVLLLIAFCISSCAVIGGIFKAGVWTGVLVVVAVLALIAWLIFKTGNNEK